MYKWRSFIKKAGSKQMQNPDAVYPRSYSERASGFCYGYAQALDGTWEEYKNSTGRFVARRSNIGDATDFMSWYMNKTKQRSGVSYQTQKSYLAYHEGKQGLPEGLTVKILARGRVNKVSSRASMYKSQLTRCNNLKEDFSNGAQCTLSCAQALFGCSKKVRIQMFARGAKLNFAAALFLINQNIKRLSLRVISVANSFGTTCLFSILILNHPLTQLGIGSGKDEHHKPPFRMFRILYRQNC